MDRVAVIIPTYNSAKYLPAAIESVLSQTYKNFDLIVVDDGSTDETKKVLEPYSDKLSYIYQPNGGPSKAMNTGILASHGTHIALLDADDLWLSHKLESQMEFMQKNPHWGLVFSDLILFDDDGRSYGTFWEDTGYHEEMVLECAQVKNAFSKLLRKNFILPSAALLKRDCFVKAGLFDESFTNAVAEDKDMWLRISLHFPIGCVPFPLVRRRLHGYSPALLKSIQRSVIDVIRKMERLYPDIMAKEQPHTKNTLAARYYFLGRIHLDQNELAEARRAFTSSIHNSFSLRAAVFLIVSLLGTHTLSYLRRLKDILRAGAEILSIGAFRRTSRARPGR